MVQRIDLSEADWWRFRAYEVRDGYILPAPGADLQKYSPRDYYRGAENSKHPQPPYLQLFEVLRRLGLGTARYGESLPKFFPLDAAGQQALLSWCSMYGLLGILLHQVHVVHLAPVWNCVRPDAVIDFPRYTRLADQWSGGAEARWSQMPNDPSTKKGDPLPEQHWPPGWRPNVVLRELRTATVIKQEPLTETWACFFPSVPTEHVETHPYPRPLTPEFWKIYAEPITDFIWAALFLKFAIEGLSERSETNWFLQWEARSALNTLIAPVTRQIVAAPNRQLQERWICPSLLASLAEMALQDLRRGVSLLRCLQCGKPFLTDAYQTLYCSERCRWRRQKQTQRKSKHGGRRRGNIARTQ